MEPISHQKVVNLTITHKGDWSEKSCFEVRK